MLYSNTDKTLQKMERDPNFDNGYSHAVADKFRMRLQQIVSAANENDLRKDGPLHFEKLKGKRKHQYSIRIDKSFRLVFQIESAGAGQNRIAITGMENYHRG